MSDTTADEQPDARPEPDDATGHENDPLGDAMQRLEDADPADTDEVLAAGDAAHEQLQNRLRDSDPS